MMTVLLESALRTLMMTATAWIALRLLRVSHVVAQKITWTLVLIAAITVPFLTQWQSLKVRPAVALPDYLLTVAPAGQLISTTQRIAVPATVLNTPIAPREQAVQRARWVFAPLRPVIAPAYLTVCSFLLLRLLFGAALAFRVWRRARQISALGAAGVAVRISSEINTPATIGFGVVLPASFVDWSPAKQRIVLAHECSHVRQADFYLQLLARLHTVIFWFSPAAWWLQKELSDLGEAISDHAGIGEAADRSSYAEMLLEFAAMPRPSLVGVPMARSNKIQRRIDRLLIDRLFRRAFAYSRAHAVIAVLIVPAALVASTSLVTVRAANPARPDETELVLTPTLQSPAVAAVPARQAAPRAALLATAAPRLQDAAAPAEPQAPVPPAAPANGRHSNRSRTGEDSYAIVNGDSSHTTVFNGDSRMFDKAKTKLHGNYILFDRDGKLYFIDDPALVQESQQLIKPMEELGRQQEALGAQQEQLGAEQERLGEQQEQAGVPTPDMSKELAGLQAALKKLEDLQKSQTLKQQDLAEVQGQIGDLQGRLGEIEGRIGEKQGKLGAQQGELGEKQGKLGEQQGKLGEQQGRLSEEVSRKMKVLIDQALRNGKAKPVE